MNVAITGRHVHLTPALENYAREKAGKVTKFLKKDVRVEIVVEQIHDAWNVEMIVNGHRGHVIVAHVQNPDAHAAVDLAIDKVEHQLRRVKERTKEHRGPSMAGEDRPAPPADDSDDADEE